MIRQLPSYSVTATIEVFTVINAERIFFAKQLTALKNKNLPKSCHSGQKEIYRSL